MLQWLQLSVISATSLFHFPATAPIKLGEWEGGTPWRRAAPRRFHVRRNPPIPISFALSVVGDRDHGWPTPALASRARIRGAHARR